MAKQIYILKHITSFNMYEIRFLPNLKCDLKL